MQTKPFKSFIIFGLGLMFLSCEKTPSEDELLCSAIVGQYRLKEDEIHWSGTVADVNNNGVGHSNMAYEFFGLKGFSRDAFYAEVKATKDNHGSRAFDFYIVFPDILFTISKENEPYLFCRVTLVP